MPVAPPDFNAASTKLKPAAREQSPMASRRALPALLLLLLPLAGCVGTEEPETLAPGAQVEDAPPAEDPAGGAAPAPSQPDAATPPAPSAPATTAVSWDGRLGTSACIPAGPGSCTRPMDADDANVLLLDEGEAPRVAALAVAWTAATPLTERLTATFYAMHACGEGCWEGAALGPGVTGTSPLVVSVEAPALGREEVLALVVTEARATPDPVYGHARVDQAFHVEGTVAWAG